MSVSTPIFTAESSRVCEAAGETAAKNAAIAALQACPLIALIVRLRPVFEF
jgi:hypothetical protein